ncbi:MAG: HEAT repeat domain-containing protein [Promethearchaeota archaeon]
MEKEEKINCDIIEISKVDDTIIQRLVNNLKLETPYLSESFFISFESLLKLGKKVRPILEKYIRERDEIHNFKVDIFNFILDLAGDKTLKHVLVPQLFHPDFVTRARTILKLEQSGDLKYIKYILCLLNDPDDSVRWAVIRFLDTHSQLIRNPLVSKEIKTYIEQESNLVIRNKMKELFKKI